MASLKHCSFDGCVSRQKDEGLSFFSLPADEKIRKQWLEIINRPDLDKPDLKLKSYVVCSNHFDKSSIIFTPKLKSGAIPTQFSQEDKACDQATQTTDSLQQLSALPEGYVYEPNDSDVDIKKEPESYDVPVEQPEALKELLELGNPRDSMETSTSSEPEEPEGLSLITVKEEPLYTEGTESLGDFILSDGSDVEDTPSCSNMKTKIISNKRPCRVEHQTSAKAPVISCPLCGHVFKAAVTESQVSAEVQLLKQALREKCYLLNNMKDEMSGLKEKNKKLDEELLFYRNHFKSVPQPIKIESLKTEDE